MGLSGWVASHWRVRKFVRRRPGRIGEQLALRVELDSWAKIDAEHAGELEPPAEERLQSRLVWIAEAYGPSDFRALIDGLGRHGFDDEGKLGGSIAELTRKTRRR